MLQSYQKINIQSIEHKEFLSFILKYLPSHSKSYSSKDNFRFTQQIPTIQALKTCQWLEFNTNWLNILIFDIDYKISIDNAINKCLSFEYEPTWVCTTDKGVHIAFALENCVNYSWQKALNLARYIKYELTELLGADENASHRLKGIWRNPLLHEYYFSGLTYNLDDFKYLLQKQKQKHYSYKQLFKKYVIKKQRLELDNFIYTLGNRNSYLWYMGMANIKDNDFKKIYDHISNLNIFESLTNQVEKLEASELIKIANSILKYNKKGINFVTSQRKKKLINSGIMNFEKMSYLSNDHYLKELKLRQHLSAKRTNNILDQEKKMTRKEAAENMRDKKHKAIITKLESALTLLRMSDEKITISKLARTAQISRITVRKYISNYKSKDGSL